MPDRFRPARRAAAPACAALLALGACSPAKEGLPTEEELVTQAVGGRWAYTASDVRLTGSGGNPPCEITGLVLTLEQLRNKGQITPTFVGNSSGGALACRGDLGFMSGALRDYPVNAGHTFNENIAFSIGTDDWRHWGTVAGDSMSGQFWLRHGSIQFEGKFVARRTSR